MENTADRDLWPVLFPALREYGRGCMAYSSLQPGLEYEQLADGGYIAYFSFRHFFWARKGVKMVLADPVCDADKLPDAIHQFVRKHPHVIFIQISASVAGVLDALGYEVNPFGIETELSLADFNLAGKQRSKLRQWRNKCQREGVSIREVCFYNKQGLADTDLIRAVQALSREWIKNKGGHELFFLTRPLRYEREPDVRCFAAYQGAELLGFAVFDPMYEAGEITGYYHNIDRLAASAPHGTSACLVLQAMEQFCAEGVRKLSLGMSPLCGIKRAGYCSNSFFHDALVFSYRHLEWIYPFKGNASHKKKFNGQTHPVFFSSTRGNSLWQLFISLKAMGLF